MEYSAILNLTQHNATPEQIEAGVIDLPPEYKKELKKLLTFDEIPTCNEIQKRAGAVYDLIIDFCVDSFSPVKKEVKELIEETKDVFGEKYIIDEKKLKELNLAFMIGGALWLMKPLIEELENIGTPLYAFTKRIVEETELPGGKIEKRAVFKHGGFIPAC